MKLVVPSSGSITHCQSRPSPLPSIRPLSSPIGLADHLDDFVFAGPVDLGDEIIDAFFFDGKGLHVFGSATQNGAGLTGSTLGDVDLGSQHGEQSCKRAGNEAGILADRLASRQCLCSFQLLRCGSFSGIYHRPCSTAFVS